MEAWKPQQLARSLMAFHVGFGRFCANERMSD
jgi:hypothetical protein